MHDLQLSEAKNLFERREANMGVGIVGAGAIAMGYAAILSDLGHTPHVWSPSGARTASLREGARLKVSGAIEGEFSPEVSTDAAALAICDVIVLALPAYGHRFVLDSLLPHIEYRHAVIISGHLSFAALYLSRRLAERGLQIPIVAWNTTVLTSKASSHTEIRVGTIRAKVDMATLPVSRAEEARILCVSLFGDRFVLKDDLLTIALSNLNPQLHMGIALCNLTRMEQGEVWRQRTNITPAVGRLLEALDKERLSLAKAFGKNVRTIFDQYALSFGVSGASVSEICQHLARNGNDPMGPTTIQTRYVLEDVPYGLTPTLYLANLAGISMPLHRSGVDILSACFGRDFAVENHILTDLGPIEVKSLLELASDGFPILNSAVLQH